MSSSNFWTLGLIKTINDAKNHLISSNLAIVINDKFPKAKHHYLVLPKESIETIFDLRSRHLDLLEEMHLLALNILEVKQLDHKDFKIGFHADPSMKQVHLHVISKDFMSEFLKTKKHWNSFNTAFFRSYTDVYQELKEYGAVKRFEKQEIDRLLKMDMLCNQCTFVAKNIPALKNHLIEHWTEKA